MKVMVFFLLFLFSIQSGICQEKNYVSAEQLFLAYTNQVRISKHWGSWTDFLLRTQDNFTNRLAQCIIRAGVTYHFNDELRLTAGYAFTNHFPADNHKQVSQPEHSPWQQVLLLHRFSRIRTIQGLRLEERFRRKILSDAELDQGYNFNYRLRYNISFELPFKRRDAQKPEHLSVIANEEINVNFGKEIVYNYFDQNRLFAGFACRLNAHNNLQFGYLNIFQQLASGNRYRKIHAFRVAYLQNLNLRKKALPHTPAVHGVLGG